MITVASAHHCARVIELHRISKVEVLAELFWYPATEGHCVAAMRGGETDAADRTPAEGVEHVFVIGTLVLEDGVPTGAAPGRALSRG